MQLYSKKKCYSKSCLADAHKITQLNISNRNLHVGLLYSLAVDFCRLYQSLGLPNWQNIYLDIYVTSKQELVQLEIWMDLETIPNILIWKIQFYGDTITEIPDLDKFCNGT
jgi:uncharacterized membrane protein YGL010W